jgi:hypothetical protein
MKRGRKTPTPTPPPPPGITKDAAASAQEMLTATYLGFVQGTATEDPRHFVARSAAAREALEHLAQLRALSGEAPSGEDGAEAEPTTDEFLAAMRAVIADENKT